jgi:DNA primase
VKALNFLLPHIRRIPEMLERSQFAQDAAQQLGIDSAVLREELRQAALKRRERVEERDKGIKRADSILVRAILAEHDLRERIAEALTEHPEWFEQLSSYSALCAMLRSVDPMAGLEDAGQRELVARIVLQAAQAPVPLSRRNSRGDLGEELAPTLELVHGTIDELHRQWLELRHRELVMDVQEAERQGDFQRAVQLAQEKLAVDRELTRIKLHGS